MTCPLDTIYQEKVGENLSQEEGTFACPSYPGRANVTFISLQNLRTVCMKNKTFTRLGRRVTRLAGSPF